MTAPNPDDYYGETIHGQDLEEWDAARPERMGGGFGLGLLDVLAKRAGRKVDRSRTVNKRTIANIFSSTHIYNDNRRSVFGGKQRRPRRWE